MLTMRTRYGYIAALLALTACGPTVPNDDDAGSGGSGSDGAPSTTDRDEGSNTSTGSSSSDGASNTSGTSSPASSTGEAESTGRPEPSCTEQKPGECTRIEGCENVSGSDVRAGDTPGEFYCSDLALPFACAESTCMRFSGILCEEGSDQMTWVIEGCIPDGWEPCPNAECTTTSPGP